MAASLEDVEQSKLATCIPAELKRIHEAMLEKAGSMPKRPKRVLASVKATRERDEGVATVARWDEVVCGHLSQAVCSLAAAERSCQC